MWGRFGAFDHFASILAIIILYYFYSISHLFGCLNLNIAWFFIRNCYIWLQVFGGTFFMFLQVSKLWWFYQGVYLPKCSKTPFGAPGLFCAFWRSLCSLLFLAGLEGTFFIVLASVQIRKIFSRNLSFKVLRNSFWWPWRLLNLLGGSLGSLFFLAGLGRSFSSFLQMSKSWRFSWGVYLPKCF